MPRVPFANSVELRDVFRFARESQAVLAGDGTTPPSDGPGDVLGADGCLNRGRLTDRARACLLNAQSVARHLGHSFVGTGHLLFGIAAQKDGIGGTVLRDLGVTPEAITEHLAAAPGRLRALGNSGVVYDSPALTARLAGAGAEALRLRHTTVGTEHLLISLMRDASGYAFRLCEQWEKFAHLVIENALLLCAPESLPSQHMRTAWSPHLQIIDLSVSAMEGYAKDAGHADDATSIRALTSIRQALADLSAVVAVDHSRALGMWRESAYPVAATPDDGIERIHCLSLLEAVRLARKDGLMVRWCGHCVNPLNVHLWDVVLAGHVDTLRRIAVDEGWGYARQVAANLDGELVDHARGGY